MKFSRSDYNGRIIDTENKIPVNEPVFLLRANDSLAPRLLLQWAMELRLLGGDPQLAAEAEMHAQSMINWQSKHGSKTPDSYQGNNSEKGIALNRLKELISSINKGEKVNIRNVSDWAIKYYGSESYFRILMPMDLKVSSRNKGINDLQYRDFDIVSDDDYMALTDAKLIIYCDSTGSRVLKFNE